MNNPDAPDHRHRDGTRIFLEVFFIVLPVGFLWLLWPAGGHAAETLWDTPELASASLVLYGLGVTKLFAAAVSRANPHNALQMGRYKIAILLTGFVMGGLSVALIHSVLQEHSLMLRTLQITNFVFAICVFVLFARHAARHGAE